MGSKFAPLPSSSVNWVDKDGKPTPSFIQYMTAHSESKNVGPLTDAATDADAGKAGVPVGGLYHSAGGVKIRLT
jgi:hypothetical protein